MQKTNTLKLEARGVVDPANIQKLKSVQKVESVETKDSENVHNMLTTSKGL